MVVYQRNANYHPKSRSLKRNYLLFIGVFVWWSGTYAQDDSSIDAAAINFAQLFIELDAKLDALKEKVATLTSENAALTKKIANMPSDGDIRLMTSDGSQELGVVGVLEVYYRGEWGTVCGDYQNNNNNMATVVCRQLQKGYNGYKVHNGAALGQGTGRIWLDKVDCTGSELRLFDCPHKKGTNYCDHDQDVGIECH